VPGDISVIGFDDIREAAYQSPSLSTVRQPLREMGEIAARRLVDRIEGQNNPAFQNPRAANIATTSEASWLRMTRGHQRSLQCSSSLSLPRAGEVKKKSILNRFHSQHSQVEHSKMRMGEELLAVWCSANGVSSIETILH
jgi:Periplasmic binding protein-like domain